MKKIKKKVSAANHVKLKAPHTDFLPSSHETSMMCTIDGDSFYTLTKNAKVGKSSAVCHTTNDVPSMFDIIDINKLMQRSFCNMKTAEKKSWVWISDRFMGKIPTHSMACEVLQEGGSKYVFIELGKEVSS